MCAQMPSVHMHVHGMCMACAYCKAVVQIEALYRSVLPSAVAQTYRLYSLIWAEVAQM